MYTTNFIKRNKWQHYEKRLIPIACVEQNKQLVQSIRPQIVLGSITIVGLHNEDGLALDVIEVTLNNGVIVPCTRINDTYPENKYVIHQNMAYKAFTPVSRMEVS